MSSDTERASAATDGRQEETRTKASDPLEPGRKDVPEASGEPQRVRLPLMEKTEQDKPNVSPGTQKRTHPGEPRGCRGRWREGQASLDSIQERLWTNVDPWRGHC